MGALSNVPFLGGYLEQDQINRAQENQGMQQAGQFMTLQKMQQDMAAKKDEIAQASAQRELINQFASKLPPDQQAEFRVDPKGFMTRLQSKREMEDFMAAQERRPAQLPGSVTGFESMPNGVPGVQGFTGDVDKLRMDIAGRQDISFDDKRAAIQQLLDQQKAGSTPAPMMPAGLMSSNKMIQDSTKFQIGQQDKRDLRSQQDAASLERQRESAAARSLQSQQHDERIAESKAQAAALKAELASAVKSGKISTVDARSIDKSLEKSSAANPALALLDNAEALYSKYESSRTEPILGKTARWGAAVGLADPARAADYEVGDQIAKDLGVIKLGLIGGSDTERELQVAIDTAPSPDKTVAANQKIIANARKAINIVQSEPDFKTEWVNQHGSLSNVDKATGNTYGKAWRAYQKQQWGGDTPAPAQDVPKNRLVDQIPGAAPTHGAPVARLTGADSQAMKWAMENPTDPRAVKIKEKLGVR